MVMHKKRKAVHIDEGNDNALLDRQNLAKSFGLMDNASPSRLQVAAGLKLFTDKFRPGEWTERRSKIMEFLWGADKGNFGGLANQKSVRVRDDESAWYIFLGEQFINDPLCNEVNQAQRILPYFAAIGSKISYSSRITRLEEKVSDFLWKLYKDPDGILFEIIVAFAYAEAGWDVEFIMEGSERTPDMLVTRGKLRFHVECKRLSRRTEYAEKERKRFLELWDRGTSTLIHFGQSIWFKGVFHTPLKDLSDHCLSELWIKSIPLSSGEHLICDDSKMTIFARRIDIEWLRGQIKDRYPVHAYSGALSNLIGGNWAPENSSVTLLPKIIPAQLINCPPSVGMYIDDIDFVCGFTREFDAEEGYDKKAKDIVKLLSGATDQVTTTIPSIVHIALETVEGTEVEHIRTKKIRARIAEFDFGQGSKRKQVAMVKVHRFQSHQRLQMDFEVDESIDTFYIKESSTPLESLLEVPMGVLVPSNESLLRTSHWERYPNLARS